ncbi:uncharacterized protein [Procambarus clarkii]|uniref:uncharacterized protein n=1 Tax=Procambarus clarkii TaxID=6728 RepID=UPI001E676547|nr:uncharacterized protein LOC123770185 [Procambarus clarkii]
MGVGSSSTYLRRSASRELRSIGRILEDMEMHGFDCASLGGMKTVYKMFHSSIYEIKTKFTITEEGDELVLCSERSEVIEKEKKIDEQQEEEKTEPTLDSVIDELDKLWEEEISPMEDAAAVFLLKLLCAVRLTLEKVLLKIA